jgi:hypothetical protein
MPHPHGTTCTCPPLPRDAGLLAYTIDCDHYAKLAKALAKLAEPAPQTATLRVLTTGPDPDNLVTLIDPASCDQTMTCDCLRCASERAERVRRGVRPSQSLPIKRREAA